MASKDLIRRADLNEELMRRFSALDDHIKGRLKSSEWRDVVWCVADFIFERFAEEDTGKDKTFDQENSDANSFLDALDKI